MRNYRQLIAWQVAFDLARRLYVWSDRFPSSETFGLRSRLRRASVSIPSNLAEGAGRATKKEFARFVSLARGTLNELETQYLLAVELGVADREVELEERVERFFGLLNGLRNSLMIDPPPSCERPTPNAQR